MALAPPTVPIRVGPGQADGLDFFGGGLAGRVRTILRRDEHPAQLADHDLVAGVGLGGVPAGPAAMLGDDAG